jgi:DNA-binding LacI/PurR family transcriptional regulator
LGKGIDFEDPTPLYEQILRDIKDRIARGELSPGDQLDTQKELAERYHVSLITIKNAQTILVNEGVLYSRVGKGTYVAEPQARRLAGPQQKMIGFVLRDLKHPYFSMMVHSIEQAANEHGFHLLLSSSSANLDKEERQIEKFRELGVQGLIIASLSFQYRATEHIRMLHDDGFSYVMVSYIQDPAYWYVGSDHAYGAFLATKHLINLGYRSIAYAHVGKGNLLSEVRKDGYVRALDAHQIPFRPELVHYLEPDPIDVGEDRYRLGYKFAKRFAVLSDRPDALFCYNDMVALGFIQGAAAEGIEVPADVAVVGFDDTVVSRYAAVPLTTIHQPVDTIGRLAVEVLGKRMQNANIRPRTDLQPALVIRESCGARLRSNPGIKKTASYP